MKIPRGQTPERKAYMKAWYDSHPKRDRSAYKAAYDPAHKAEIAAYRAANKEKIKIHSLKKYAKNRDAIIERATKWNAKNREKHLVHMRAYYARNVDKCAARGALWKKANPLKVVLLSSRRRARKAGNGGSHTIDERVAKFDSLWNVCYYCLKPKKMTADHDIPIIRGGTDDIDNILPACQPCNARKGKKTAEEFIATGRTARTVQAGPVEQAA